jgi:hypothetical protein
MLVNNLSQQLVLLWVSEHIWIQKMHQARRHLTYADTLQVAGIDIFHRTDNDVQDSDTDDDSEDDSEDNSKNGSEGRCEESCEEDSDAVQELDKIRWNLNAHFRDAPSKHDLKPEEFDLINSRFLADGINKERWKPLVEEYKKLLRPGGWLQMAEAQWLFRSQSGQDLPALKEWSKKYYEGLSLMRKAPDIARQLERIVRWEGFERVSATTHDIHLEGWRPGTHGCVLILTSLRAGRLTNV